MDLDLYLLVSEPDPRNARVLSLTEHARLPLPIFTFGDRLNVRIYLVNSDGTFHADSANAALGRRLALGIRGQSALAQTSTFTAITNGYSCVLDLDSTQLELVLRSAGTRALALVHATTGAGPNPTRRCSLDCTVLGNVEVVGDAESLSPDHYYTAPEVDAIFADAIEQSQQAGEAAAESAAAALVSQTAAAGSAAAASADRVQTGLDAAATAADRVQTGLDKVATAADRVQTGLDKAATAADRVQTGLDRVATAADRVQTGLDRVQTTSDKNAAAASAALASSVLLANVAPHLAACSQRGGLISTGASAYATTQSNTGNNFGTSAFSFFQWVNFSNYTPGSSKYFALKFGGGVGWSFGFTGAGNLFFEKGNGAGITTYTCAVALGAAANAWVMVGYTVDPTGNVTFYKDGAQIGVPISIAALSAQTVSNTTPLSWGNTGTAGIFGEAAFATGLLTATQISDIHRAGSAAPFAASLSLFRVEFGQGYGAIIRGGNNQHALIAASGVSHLFSLPDAVAKATPPGKYRFALSFDGSSVAQAHSTLNAQNPGTGDFTLRVPVQTTLSTSAGQGLAALSSSNAGTAAARALVVYNAITSGNFGLRIYGATTSDFREWNIAGIFGLLGGQPHEWFVRRDATGIRIFVGIGLSLLDVTNLASTTTGGGSPPAATDQIDGTYLVLGRAIGANLSGRIFEGAGLANVAMSEAQLRSEYERCEPGYEWRLGSRAQVITGDNSTGVSDTGFWTKNNGATISGGKFNITGGANSNIVRALVIPLGQKAIIGYDVDTIDAAAYIADGSINTLATPSAAGMGSVGVKRVEVVGASGRGIQFVSPNGTLVIDNITVELVGWTTRLRTDRGCTKQAADDSVSGNDFLLSATGVVYAPSQRVGNLRALNVNVGTAAYLLASQDILDAGYDVSEVRITNNSGGTANTVGLQLSDGTNHTDLFAAANILAGETAVYRPTVAGLDARRRLRATAVSGASDLTFSITVTNRK